MLVGLPASGKSTYVAEFLTYNPDWVHISTDLWIEEMCTEKGLTYSEGFAKFAGPAEKKMYASLVQAIKDGRNIIWDQTNLTITARKKKLTRLPITYEKKCIYFVLPDKKEWEKRLASRPGKVIDQKILHGMRKMFQMPSMAEGFLSVEIRDTSLPI
jgi:predicted kinase